MHVSRPTWLDRHAGRVLLAGALAAGGLLATPAWSQTSTEEIYNSGAFPPSFRQTEIDADATGRVETYQPGGGLPDVTRNPFFQSLGSNGRSCATCHQPPSAMGLSRANILARYTSTGGADPLFDPIDGANCPNKPGAHGLLLDQGVFRIPITVPSNAEFTVSVSSDPTTCNTDRQYNQTTDPKTGETLQVVSVFRRPLMAADLAFVTNPIPVQPGGQAKPPAIMWDARETSLTQQAIDATMGHAQALTAPTAVQVAAIVKFESGIFAAQLSDLRAGNLNAGGATGGPIAAAQTVPGQFPAADEVFHQFDSWSGLTGSGIAAHRASIARGQAIFGTRTFNYAGVEGINQQPFVNTCGRCHSQPGDGNDPHGSTGRLGIGVGGSSPKFGGRAPLQTLPIFKVTCKPGFTTQYHGSEVTTNDPGAALITGLCADIEKFKTPGLRGLAARAPYFHDGSAATLTDVVNFYNTRFAMGLSAQDTQDLANFLAAL